MPAEPAPSPPAGPPLPRPRAGWVVVCLLPALMSSGCRQAMYDQPRYEAYEASAFFEDGKAMRPLIAGTVARGQLRDDDHRFAGKVDGKDAETFPYPIEAKDLARGRERYMIFCSPCHGAVGDGKGMIVQRGLPAPPSFHTEELRKMPVGHYFDVISNGYGAMYPYDYRIPPDDRWAIIAYVRALQLSQDTELASIPADLRREIEQELARPREAGSEAKPAAHGQTSGATTEAGQHGEEAGR